jgi:hypothetical protein
MTTTLQDKAMLVTLTINCWTNRKYDKTVSTEVELSHAAKDAGRYNKLLIDKAALDPITKIGNAARSYHYALTLPWGDNNERLLPGALFMDYGDQIRQFKSDFAGKVRDFLTHYPKLVNDARERLGTMYNPLDYPAVEDIKGKFGLEVSFTGIPSAKDFRVDLNEAYVSTIRREIEERTNQRIEEAMKNCWARVREVVTNMHTRLSDKDAKFRDSLVENARELVAILPALNITGDPELTKIGIEIEGLLLSPDRLRHDPGKRAETADKAAAILARMTGFA